MRLKFTSTVWSALVLAKYAFAQGELAGYPGDSFGPYCAMACIRTLMSLMLDCSSMGQTIGMMTMTTTTECWAQNTPYLTSLAWCMHTKCAEYNVSASRLEKFWEEQTTGQQNAGAVTVPPKWSYGAALAAIDETPTFQLAETDMDLNTTAIVAPITYLKQYNVLSNLQRESTIENTYGISMLVVGFGLPIVLTFFGYLPIFGKVFKKLNPYLVWPSTIGTYQVRPLPYLIGNAPTVGQTLYVIVFVVLNIIFTCIGFRSRQPNAWYENRYFEIMSFVMYRTGIFGYTLAPLVFLFGTRNNILLWATNWSHSTFIILHRWVARVFAFQSLLHSVLAVILYKQEGRYEMDSAMLYWKWGIVATMAVVVLTFGSQLFIRSWAYEVFLLTHIVFAVITLVGFWYHAYTLYKWLGGYQTWIYCCIAVWFGDRLVRVWRLALAGLRRAKVTEIGAGYVRIDVPGIRWGTQPGKHVYFYFPTLHPLKPWENHPFSVLHTALLAPPPVSYSNSASDDHSQVSEGRSSSDVEKNQSVKPEARQVVARKHRPLVGLTVFVRKSTGATKHLVESDNLLTFVEGPYPNNSTKDVLCCDRLLLIGGGIGITSLLPFVNNHWNVRVAWSVRESARCLVNNLEPALSMVADKEVRIGSRLDIKQLLTDEADAGWDRVGVVVSGPGGLCDDVRAAVVTAAKLGKTDFELEVEAYSW